MASSMGCLRAEAATDKAAVLADVDPMIGVSTAIPRRGAHGALIVIIVLMGLFGRGYFPESPGSDSLGGVPVGH